mmetsp:Transcript_95435/g.269679  ORF Transcript_95435/g.269679 Transcript_95435/m.269679 type:complete len:333 (+) Transcript_95435:61-1059(+)
MAGMILVGGENLIDFIQAKELTNGLPSYRANPGGSPFNAAKALGRQLRGGTSGTVGYLTPISSDTLGELLAQQLEEADVALLAPRRSEPTSLAIVSLREGVPSYQFYRESTAERMVTPEGLETAAPGDATAMLLGSLALANGADADVWADFYCAQHAAGRFTVCDPNIRAAFIHNRDEFMARLDRVLAHSDLVKLSDEDLQWISPGEPDLRKSAAEMLKRSGAKLLITTLGGDGAFALRRAGADGELEEVSVGAAKVAELRDTVGAGDTFCATLLATLAASGRLSASGLEAMARDDVEALLRRAAQAAAINCGREGCNPPTTAEVDAALAGA